MSRLEATFASLRHERRVALMPYLPLGYPSVSTCLMLVRAAAESGADVLELGMPFSDPLADGPVIQHATQVALANGVTLADCLTMVDQVRSAGVIQPLVLMGYYNPILRFGLDRFGQAAQEVGVDGFIIADLPPDEARPFRDVCTAHQLDLIHLIAPNSPEERLRMVVSASQGFVYLVSVTGVTGTRSRTPEGLLPFVRRARALTTKPLCVGFGISDASSARETARLADGVIVGSALVERMGAENPERAVRQLVRELREAVDAATEGATRNGKSIGTA